VKTIKRLAVLAATASLLLGGIAHAAPAVAPNVGLQMGAAPVAGDSAVKLTVFYPTAAPSRVQQLGPYSADVAFAAAPDGKRLPLIIMSHGTGGSAFGSLNLAVALARAGYVVAALEHTGDNYKDQSRAFSQTNFSGRAAQVRATIDYMLKGWSGHATLDPKRVGMFGYSAGGTTALIIGGGVLDWKNVIAHCMAHPEVFGCRAGQKQTEAAGPMMQAGPTSGADPRVKAIVAAVPALAPGFAPDGLKAVRRSVQLWVAQEDKIVADAGQLRRLFPRKPDYHLVPNADHASLLAPCTASMRTTLAFLCTDPKGFDRESFQQEFVKRVIGFYKAKLK
jgi:predicted dienelactone hydrolase